MAKRKRELTPEQQLAQQIYATLKPQTVGDVTEGLKKIFGPMIEAALQGELENHLGYDHHERTPESKGNSRNGYSKKTIKTSQGETEIKVPRDRNGSFEPQIVPKYKRDISEIEDKIIAMYGRGMSQRDIAQTIDEIYGFNRRNLWVQTLCRADFQHHGLRRGSRGRMADAPTGGVLPLRFRGLHVRLHAHRTRRP